MRLYLMRHGEAVPKENDKTKTLAERGISEVKRVADFTNIKTESIWVSRELRARQTAQILKEYGCSDNIVEQEGLAPNDPTDVIYSKIISYESDLIIVSHLPFLSYLASNLLSLSEDIIDIDFSTAAVLSLEGKGKSWAISWFITPALIR
jgi:phosphohistidine phosphatase